MKLQEMAKEAGFALTQGSYWQNVKGTDAELRKFAELVAAAERERCAKLCEAEKVEADLTGEPTDRAYNIALRHAAAAIRAS